MEQQIKIALDYLVKEQSLGYSEAVHKLTFPLPGRWGVQFETHETVFFQRVTVLNTLVMAKKAGYFIPGDAIEKETQLIIHSRHPHVSGGWSYFPQIDHFPPDVDDLGAVVQVASHLSDNTLHQICDESIEVVLRNCLRGDGSIETWILDYGNGGEILGEIKRCIEIIGGKGVHVEVIANFLEALITYNLKRYNRFIRTGASYLVSIQNDNGTWDSKWYWNHYYGTYKAMRVIHAVDAESEATKKATDFLMREQHDNGAWGPGQGNPLNTSFAILALSSVGTNTFFNRSISMAVDYLCRTQTLNGNWNSFPFIKMDSKSGMLSYGSRTLTTSYAIHALLTVKGHLN